MKWLHTLLCGICIVIVAWIVVTYSSGTAFATNPMSAFIGEPEPAAAPAPTPVVADLTEVPAFAELQARPLRDMRSAISGVSAHEAAAERHQEMLAAARRKNALLATAEPAPTAQRTAGRTPQQRRQEIAQARRLNSQRAQSKYNRRQTTTFERTRHYSANRYAYEYSNSDGRHNSRLSSNRTRNMRIARPSRRRR